MFTLRLLACSQNKRIYLFRRVLFDVNKKLYENEGTTFKQEMFHSEGEIVPRIKRFTFGKGFVANDIICYGDKHLMFSSICMKEGNSLFPAEIALEFGLNIHWQESTARFPIILNFAKFHFLLKI